MAKSAAKKKITVAELNAKISDLSIPEEDLARYFDLDAERSGPLDPTLKLNPDNVKVPPPSDKEGRRRSAALLNNANWLSRLRRQAQYQIKVGSGGYNGPLVVSEGDSWFQYPFLLKDVIDHLSADLAIFSLGASGDTLDNMVREAEYLDALEDTGGSILLLSGGGNDLVAGGNLAMHLRDFDPALPPEGHLRASFDALLDHAMAQIERIARTAGRAFPGLEVVCHGYDYSLPDKGRWLGKPMEARGITDNAFQRALARVMVDRLNVKLHTLATANPRLHYVDCRGAVDEKAWYDELHPNDAGYGAVAARFKALIGQLAPQPRAVDHRTRTAPAARAEAVADARAPRPRRRARRQTPPEAARATGRSLHVGLNLVDPKHYEGWDGELAACENDAKDMEAIAASVGFKTTRLLTKSATLDAVTQAIAAAAKASQPGDIFLMSYAGHGAQVNDFNGDEEDDRLDETLCLYDGQIIDDELYVLWSQFRAGVRVLVVSDCCHSGSNVRGKEIKKKLAEGRRPRAMPRALAAKVAQKNREFYRARAEKAAAFWQGAATREMALPLAASVRLLSAVQDNQLALDGDANGLFTGRLCEVWGNGAFQGDYSRFFAALGRDMPPEQSPNHMFIGEPSPAFDAQRPFDI